VGGGVITVVTPDIYTSMVSMSEPLTKLLREKNVFKICGELGRIENKYVK
jgi:hypothetical protein